MSLIFLIKRNLLLLSVFFFFLETNGRSIDYIASSIFISFHYINGYCFFFFLSLSQEGLFNLLDRIEGRLHCEQTCMYGGSSIDERRLNRIIRCALPVVLQTLPSYPFSH